MGKGLGHARLASRQRAPRAQTQIPLPLLEARRASSPLLASPPRRWIRLGRLRAYPNDDFSKVFPAFEVTEGCAGFLEGEHLVDDGLYGG